MSGGETLGMRAFARLIGKRASYITQLREEGRLVLTPDGQRVMVAESIERIKETSDPAKFAVAARHAANRQQGGVLPPTAPPSSPPEPAERETDTAAMAAYQDSRAKREYYEAKKTERDYQISMGQLLPADDVLKAITSAITTLRNRLEALPAILAPQLAPITDEGQSQTLLADAIEHALEDTARQFQKLSHPKGETP